MNQVTTTDTTFAPGAAIIRIVASPCDGIGDPGTIVAATSRSTYDVRWKCGQLSTNVPAAHLAPAPTFAAYTVNETTRSSVGVFHTQAEAMRHAKEAAKADKKRMPRQVFAPLVVELAPTNPAAKQMPAGEKRLRALSEQVKQHLVSLGCALLPDAEKSPFYDWEATLPTAAGLLSVSVHISNFALYETDSFIVHGCFPSPELFRRTFCDCNHINPASGKWNVYVTEKSTSNDLADALRYYSRMIPTLAATLAPTNPGPPATLPPFSGDFDLGCRISPTEAYLRPNARTVVFYLDTAVGQFPRTAPHCLLRRLLRLLGVHSTSSAVHWTSARAHRVFCIDETNALALRISEEANQLEHQHGGFTPARAALIARRELGRTAPTNPAPELTPPEPMPTTPKPAGKFPFAVARRNGDRVVLLHQIGKCAVARVYPADKSPAYHLCRYRQFYADFEGLDEAGAAFQTLRRLDDAERHRDAETLTAADALDQLTVSRACLDQFCELHGLDVDRAHSRRDVRRAITDLRPPRMAVYLALLKTLNPTNHD